VWQSLEVKRDAWEVKRWIDFVIGFCTSTIVTFIFLRVKGV
jgi:hypothetical protein